MTKKKKIKNVVTLENLMVFLNQNPRINLDIGKAFFDCPFCKEEALAELEEVLCRSGLENLKRLDVAFGTIIFDLEVQALLSKTKKIYPDFYPLLFTAIFTGMRQGEIMALTWDSINWITKKITIDKNYTHGKLGTPKTGKIRVIDMSDELVKVLREWRIACPHSEYNLIFPNNEGNYQSAENMMKRRFLLH